MTLKEIESAVEKLDGDEYRRFRAWLAELEADRWDKQIETDVRAGKLDRLLDEAREHHRLGRTKPL